MSDISLDSVIESSKNQKGLHFVIPTFLEKYINLEDDEVYVYKCNVKSEQEDDQEEDDQEEDEQVDSQQQFDILVYRDGDILADRTVHSGDVSSESTIQDVQLWAVSQVMAHKHMHLFDGLDLGGDDDDEDDEDYEPEDDDDDDDEPEDDDQEQLEEEIDEDNVNQDDDEDDDPMMQSMQMLQGLREQLQGIHDKEDEDLIKQEEIQKIWLDIASKLNKNAISFIAFRNALSAFVKEILFLKNPVMKMMNKFSDPAPADQEDLIQLIEEVTEKTFKERNPNITVPSEMIDMRKKIHAKYEQWKDDYEYLNKNYELDEQNNDAEWHLLGADIQRLQIGSFTVARKWMGQFRFKVDIYNKQLIYYMFDYAPTPIPQKDRRNIYQAERFREYMYAELDRFLSSTLYKIVTPLSFDRIQYHSSTIDPPLAMAVVELSEQPDFYGISIKDLEKGEWKQRWDITEDQQAIQYATHYVIGVADQLSAWFGMIFKASKELKHKYEEERIGPAIVGTNPNTDDTDWEIEDDQIPNDDDVPFKSSKESEGNDCCIM